jgi:hypothetical protein
MKTCKYKSKKNVRPHTPPNTKRIASSEISNDHSFNLLALILSVHTKMSKGEDARCSSCHRIAPLVPCEVSIHHHHPICWGPRVPKGGQTFQTDIFLIMVFPISGNMKELTFSQYLQPPGLACHRVFVMNFSSTPRYDVHRAARRGIDRRTPTYSHLFLRRARLFILVRKYHIYSV